MRLTRNQFITLTTWSGFILFAVLAQLNPRLDDKFVFAFTGFMAGYAVGSLMVEYLPVKWGDE